MDNKEVGTGCGCLLLIIQFIFIVLAVNILCKACEDGSLFEGAVKVTKEYYMTADSIWNAK